jgi:hypothetical protein
MLIILSPVIEAKLQVLALSPGESRLEETGSGGWREGDRPSSKGFLEVKVNPSSDQRHYRAYILRLWQERPASSQRPSVWRFSLQDTRARQRYGFGDLKELAAFLEDRMRTEDGTDDRDEETT